MDLLSASYNGNSTNILKRIFLISIEISTLKTVDRLRPVLIFKTVTNKAFIYFYGVLQRGL